MSRKNTTVSTLPRYSYIVRFHHLSCPFTDEYEYYDEQEALSRFNMTDEDDEELYSSVELIRYDYREKTAKLLAITFFMDREDEEDCQDNDIFNNLNDDCEDCPCNSKYKD